MERFEIKSRLIRVTEEVTDDALFRRAEFRLRTTAREKAENVLKALDDAVKTRQFLDPRK